MGDTTATPAETPAPRSRRRLINVRSKTQVTLVILGCAALLFAGGILAWTLSFQHKQVCQGGVHPLRQMDPGVGPVLYECPASDAGPISTVTVDAVPS